MAFQVSITPDGSKPVDGFVTLRHRRQDQVPIPEPFTSNIFVDIVDRRLKTMGHDGTAKVIGGGGGTAGGVLPPAVNTYADLPDNLEGWGLFLVLEDEKNLDKFGKPLSSLYVLFGTVRLWIGAKRINDFAGATGNLAGMAIPAACNTYADLPNAVDGWAPYLVVADEHNLDKEGKAQSSIYIIFNSTKLWVPTKTV